MYDLELISMEILNQITEILSDFDIEYTEYNNRISMPCPIHGGDNPNGLSILLEDVGNWQCFTHLCHETYDSSILGFIQALLSTQYNREVTRREAIEWSARFVGIEATSKETYQDKKDKTNFMNLYKYVTTKKNFTSEFVPRNVVRKSLKIPAPQMLGNYSQAILLEYDVGLCNNPTKSMFNRVVVPFYNETGEYMLGCSGRSIFPLCDQCKKYHLPGTRCPMTKIEKQNSVKWKNSGKFNAELYLYNYWKARQHIQENGMAILVEGPGDVWRLEEAGIHYSLALLGTKFTDSQREILEQSNILHLIIATDNDEAGQKSRSTIERKCNRLFNIHHIYLEKNDIGDMTVSEVQEKFEPFLEEVKARNHVFG